MTDRHNKTLSLTAEQQYAVDLAVTRTENLKINALAGTGKTSTLRAIASHLPHKKILYLAFNKAVQLEASQSFPRNVVARTIHSLAYRNLGVYDDRWQRKLAARCTIRDYAKFLGIDLRTPRAQKLILCFREALKEFQHSSDRIPSSKHIPPIEFKTCKTQIEKEWICNVVDEYVLRFWQCMKDPEQTDFAMTHDTYLKLWQLSNPIIEHTDIIMLDEAQDANPVMIDILKQQSARLILVGDTWQQIYSFRGAVNAMANIQTPLTCYLTQSFRFGQEIADLANRILKLRHAPTFLRGFPERESALGPLPVERKYTSIFRYNIELLEEAYDLAVNGFRIHILGSLDKTAAVVLDVYSLFAKEPERIRDARLRVFKSWSELEENFDVLDDMELKKSFRFVERYAFEIPKIIATIKKADAPTPQMSDVILTTGHKSKGQEWNYVRISEDFYDAIKNADWEELNLLYVAFTRAILHLEVPPMMLEILDLAKNAKKKKVRKKIKVPVREILEPVTPSEAEGSPT